jgi:hypothetical protein
MERHLKIKAWVQLRNRVVEDVLDLETVEGTPADLIERIANERYGLWLKDQLNGGYEIVEAQ